MQTLETILVGGIIVLAIAFLLRTFWPSSARKGEAPEGETRTLCGKGSCGCSSQARGASSGKKAKAIDQRPATSG